MSELKVNSDGTVDAVNKWRPGGARGNQDQVFTDGECYIFAVCVFDYHDKSKYWWEVETVTAHCGVGTPVEFDSSDGGIYGWPWLDVEWFIPMREINLPFEAQE